MPPLLSFTGMHHFPMGATTEVLDGPCDFYMLGQ